MNYQDIKIIANGQELPAPISIDTELSDLDADTSIRSITTGTLRRNVIRTNILKLTLKYGLQEMARVQEILMHLPAPNFPVTLYDVKTGERAEKTMYAGNRKFSYKVAGSSIMVDGLSFSLTEV